MSQSRVDRYRRWFEYERDSHRKVIASLQTVPEDQRDYAHFQKALELMGHIVAARQMWLFRLGAAPDKPDNLFPTGLTLEELERRIEMTEQTWEGYLQLLSEADLDRTFEYQSLDAGGFRSVIEDILTQLFGHSLYHRGQIATLVRASGGTPAATDFVYWSRKPIPPPPG